MKIIKKYYKKILYFAIMLTAVIGACFGIGKTFALTIDENGNVISDNLFHSNSKETLNNITFEFNGSQLDLSGVWSGSSDLYYGFNLLSDLELNETYTISFTTNNTSILYDAWINGIHYYCDYDSPMTISNLTSTIKNANWRFVLPNGDYNYTSIKIMINKGSSALSYEPYGAQWINSNVLNLQSNIITSLIDSDVKMFLTDNPVPSMTYNDMISQSPYISEKFINGNIPFYDMQQNNPVIFNSIYNDIPSSRYAILFYQMNVPLNVDNLIFNRGDTTGTRYITLYFDNGNSTQLTITEGSDNNRNSVSWVNENKLNIIAISTTAEIGYNAVDTWTMNASSQIYADGYYNGYYSGYNEGNANGLKSSNEEIYRNGYYSGYNEGVNSNVENNGFRVLFNSILSYPVNMLKSVFNFEFMGINIASVIMFIVSIGIVIFVVKRFK